MLIGREQDITEFNEFLEDQHVNALCLYGRRGVGKTAFIREFLKDKIAEKKAVYFTAYATTDAEELRLLSDAMGMEEPATDLKTILDKITNMASEGQVVFCIENYGDFAKAGDSFDGILQEYVYNAWNDGSVKLILVDDMYFNVERFLTGKKASWRISKIKLYELEPLGFYDTVNFLGNDYAIRDAAFIYGITGGIPGHLERVKGLKGDEAVKALYMDGLASLVYSPENVMGTELRELSYYNRMLMALADGNTRVNEISTIVNKPKDVVVPYFNTLMSMGIVQKTTPVTEKTNRKKTRYSIVSTADLYWYKNIAPNMNLYHQGRFDEILKLAKANQNEYLRQVFIEICSEYLITYSAKGELPFDIEEIGNWWVNDDEKGTSMDFDMVALGRQQGKTATIFCRCYYTEKPVDLQELKALIDLTKLLEHNGDRFYLIFSQSGFAETAKTAASAIMNIMLINMDELA